MASISQVELRRFAIVGARARLAAIEAEAAALVKSFPELRKGDQGESKASKAVGSTSAPVRRRKNRMSTEGRKAVSERMKRYWAERRKAKGKAK